MTHAPLLPMAPPSWLTEFTPGQPFVAQAFFASRVVFYPGSGRDGSPIRFFGTKHLAHCFVFVDYWVPQREIERELAGQHTKFKGYSTLAQIQLTEQDLVARPPKWHLYAEEIPERAAGFMADMMRAPFGMVAILQREAHLDDQHGPTRMAVLFLGADAVATYDALFCQPDSLPPFAVVVQDHGFGGQYTRFDAIGLLARLAERTDVRPELLWCARGSEPWLGYALDPTVPPERGGVHNTERLLYRRVE